MNKISTWLTILAATLSIIGSIYAIFFYQKPSQEVRNEVNVTNGGFGIMGNIEGNVEHRAYDFKNQQIKKGIGYIEATNYKCNETKQFIQNFTLDSPLGASASNLLLISFDMEEEVKAYFAPGILKEIQANIELYNNEAMELMKPYISNWVSITTDKAIRSGNAELKRNEPKNKALEERRQQQANNNKLLFDQRKPAVVESLNKLCSYIHSQYPHR